MEIKVRFTASDYWVLCVALILWQPIVRVVCGTVLAVAWVVGMIFFALLCGDGYGIAALYSSSSVMIAVAVLYLSGKTIAAALWYGRGPNCSSIVHISAEGLRVAGFGCACDFKWPYVRRIIETRRHIIVLTGICEGYALRKDAIEPSDSVQHFIGKCMEFWDSFHQSA